MVTRKTTTGRPAAKTTAKQTARPAPAKKVPVQAAPHVKTMANGKPRPKRRG